MPFMEDLSNEGVRVQRPRPRPPCREIQEPKQESNPRVQIPPSSPRQSVNVGLCSECRAALGLLIHDAPRDTGGEVCVDVWSSVWAAVDLHRLCRISPATSNAITLTDDQGHGSASPAVGRSEALSPRELSAQSTLKKKPEGVGLAETADCSFMNRCVLVYFCVGVIDQWYTLREVTCVFVFFTGVRGCVFISDTSSTQNESKKTFIHLWQRLRRHAGNRPDPRLEAPGSAPVEVLLHQRKPILLKSFNQEPCSNRPWTSGSGLLLLSTSSP